MMDVPQKNWQPRVLGAYHLLHRIALGPEGEVWLAYKTASQRQVIIKLLPSVFANDHGYRRQFNQTMRMVVTLSHMHILPVYDFGAMATSSDKLSCFLVLPFIEGITTLQERLHASNNTPMPLDKYLHYLEQAALALDFAHSRQILHLGLTPTSILLNGDLLMLTNFGLIPLFATQQPHTSTSLNTNPYLSPEQNAQRDQATSTPLTGASDLYSLAVIAYQLFMGRLPIPGNAGPSQNMATYSTQLAFPPAVENIFAKALAREPSERYSSCHIFVQALERAWQGLPLVSELDPERTLMAPWNKHLEKELPSMQTYVKPTVSNQAANVLPDASPSTQESSITPTYITRPTNQLLEGSVAPTYITRPTDQQRNSSIAPTYVTRPDQPLESSVTTTYINQPAPNQGETTLPPAKKGIGRRTLLIGGAAAVVLVGGGTLATTAILRGRSTKPAGRSVPPVHFAPGRTIAKLSGHTDTVTNVAWSPDGRYLASASLDKFAMLWDLAAILHQSSSSPQTLSQPTREWNVYPFGLSPSSLNWTPDGRSLLTITSDCPSLLNPLSSTSKPRVYSDPTIKKDLLSFSCPIASPQNTMLAAIDATALHRNHKIDLWHPATPTAPYTTLTYTDASQFIGDSSTMQAIAWSPDGTQVAGITSLNEVVAWDVKSRKVTAVVKLPERVKDEANALVINILLAWSPTDPQRLAVTNIDTVAIVDVQQKKVLQQLYINDKEALNSAKNPQDPKVVYPNVCGFTWSPDGRYIAACYARSSKIFVWDLQAKNATVTHGLTIQSAFFPQNDDGTTAYLPLAWSPDGHYLAAGSSDHSITVWQVDAEQAATTV